MNKLHGNEENRAAIALLGRAIEESARNLHRIILDLGDQRARLMRAMNEFRSEFPYHAQEFDKYGAEVLQQLEAVKTKRALDQQPPEAE